MVSPIRQLIYPTSGPMTVSSAGQGIKISGVTSPFGGLRILCFDYSVTGRRNAFR